MHLSVINYQFTFNWSLDLGAILTESTPLAPSYESSWGRVISSTSLLGKDKSVVIVHDGQRYVLSITKLGKLILTK